MAKEDFCFTYYDGDSARDCAHMTRLCRGAYHDLVIMQRKVGPMTITQVKMVLSSDFETCWPALELILKQTEDQKYFIEWVENSVKEMRKSSKKQSEKIKKYWEEVKNGTIPRNKKSIPQYKNNNDLEEPLGDEDGDGYKFLKEGTGENFLKTENVETEAFQMPLGHRMYSLFSEKNKDYPMRPSNDVPAIISIAEFIHQQNKEAPKNIYEMDVGEQQHVFEHWQKWCNWYGQNGNNKSLEYLVKFKIQEIYLELKNGKKNATDQRNFTSKPAKNTGANELLTRLTDELSGDG